MISRHRKLLPAAAALLIALWSLALQAKPQAGASGVSPADQKELYNYTLTMDKLRKLAGAQKDLEALQKSNPDIAKSMDADEPSSNLDQLVQKIQKFPPVVGVLQKNGIAPREFIVSTMVLVQASIAVGMKKAGTYKDYPPKMLELISQANLTFTEQHWDELQKMMPAFSSGGDGGTGEK